MAAIDWRNAPTIPKRPYCGKCRGTGIFRVGKKLGPWQRCTCGRLPNATAALKLAKQDTLTKRLEDVKTKGWI